VKICAVADLHGRLPEIPECDVLVIAGDICPDIEGVGWDHDIMVKRQMEWLADEYYEWELTLPTKKILVTPGNHDWVNTFPSHCRSQMFIDKGLRLEEDWDSRKQTCKTFWFTPWVGFCGAWNYVATRDVQRYYFENIPPKLDLLVTHSPAHDCGDKTYGNEPVGSYEMRDIILRRQPKRVVFGHIHEGQRYGKDYRLGDSKLHHCSMWGDAWKPTVFDI
jgi:Icc-related predicted phosphoesterase